jgi:type IV pilus assembly protein PilV
VSYTPTPDQVALRPSYGGSCDMTITWMERGVTVDGASAEGQSLQTFAWEFQP